MSLSALQLSSFHEKGFIKIPGIIPAALLSRLRQLFDELMNDETDTEGKAYYPQNGINYVTNLEHICRRGNLSCLELLGSPFMLEIAAQICGPDFFMIQEFAVIKNKGDGLPVYWHQDMVHERTGQCFTVGIYLDEVEEHDGALRVVPGSHLAGKEICELCKQPFIEVPMEAGDILIHDMMLAHSSRPMEKREKRRVIYFEFLSRQQVLQENIYSEELIQNRMQLLETAIRYYRQLHEQDNDETGNQETDIHAALADIYSYKLRPRPSTYCFEV